MKRLFLLTGSNLGDSIELLKLACCSIEKNIGEVKKKSGIYQSLSWGYKSSRIFYNQCLEVWTDLPAHEILDLILETEALLGRKRISEQYSDREIDIDILFFGDEIIDDSRLVIPHPRLQLRKFALVPMNEIADDFVHPVFGKTVSQLFADCEDKSVVTPNP